MALELIEGKVLGGGAFSRVSKVTSTVNQRQYALKRMRKSTVLQCPEHVFCEQHITRNTAHPFCIRQVCVLYDRYPFCLLYIRATKSQDWRSMLFMNLFCFHSCTGCGCIHS